MSRVFLDIKIRKKKRHNLHSQPRKLQRHNTHDTTQQCPCLPDVETLTLEREHGKMGESCTKRVTRNVHITTWAANFPERVDDVVARSPAPRALGEVSNRRFRCVDLKVPYPVQNVAAPAEGYETRTLILELRDNHLCRVVVGISFVNFRNPNSASATSTVESTQCLQFRRCCDFGKKSA